MITNKTKKNSIEDELQEDFIPNPLFPYGNDSKPEEITYEEWREIEQTPAVKKIFGEPGEPYDDRLGDIEYGVKFHITWWDFKNKGEGESDLFVFFEDPTKHRPMILLRDTKTGKVAVLQEPCQYQKTKATNS